MSNSSHNNMTKKSELRTAILEAFPPKIITLESISEDEGGWDIYDNAPGFEAGVAGQSWDTLDVSFIETHYNALIYLGCQSFKTILPAYLSYLIDNDAYNNIPFVVAGTLTRTKDPLQINVFEQRVSYLSHPQRLVIKQVLLALKHDHMKEVMSTALASYWQDIPEESA